MIYNRVYIFLQPLFEQFNLLTLCNYTRINRINTIAGIRFEIACAYHEQRKNFNF